MSAPNTPKNGAASPVPAPKIPTGPKAQSNPKSVLGVKPSSKITKRGSKSTRNPRKNKNHRSLIPRNTVYSSYCAHDLTDLWDHYCPPATKFTTSRRDVKEVLDHYFPSEQSSWRWDHYCPCSHEVEEGSDHYCPCQCAFNGVTALSDEELESLAKAAEGRVKLEY